MKNHLFWLQVIRRAALGLLLISPWAQAQNPAPAAASNASFAPAAPEPKPLGVPTPAKVNIHWTAYFITPAKMADEGKGRVITYTDISGKNFKLRITEECYRQSEIEAAAVGVDKNGVEHFAYRVSSGVWKELPNGSAGMGNKLNSLVPMDHVAAQQSKFPYGSMIFVPAFVGLKLGNNQNSDGYFWVSDVGSGVTGNHFDLFVGSEVAYKDVLSRDKKPTYPTIIYKLPPSPKGMDPRTNDGLAAILRAQGFLKGEATPAEKDQVLEALIAFQQANPEIPVAEYGNPRAATTLWFLIQAALKAPAAA